MSTSSINNDIKKAAVLFKEKYRYKINGQTDALFEKLARMLPTAGNAIETLKSKRIAEKKAIAALEASEPDINLRNVAIAKEKMKFLRAAVKVAQDSAATKSGSRVTDVLKDISDELETTLNDYVAARTALGGLNATDDTAFLRDVQQAEDKLDRLAYKQKPRLLAEKQLFNLDLIKARKNFSEIEETITGLNILV